MTTHDDTPSKSPRRKRPEIFNPPEPVVKVTWEKSKRFRKVPSKGLIEDRLYWRIRGYGYEEVTEELREYEDYCSTTGAKVLKAKMVITKIVHKQVAPDTSAIIFGAVNLIPEKYKQKQTIENTGKDGGPIQFEEVGAAKELLASRIAGLAAPKPEGSDPEGVESCAGARTQL